MLTWPEGLQPGQMLCEVPDRLPVVWPREIPFFDSLKYTSSAYMSSEYYEAQFGPISYRIPIQRSFNASELYDSVDVKYVCADRRDGHIEILGLDSAKVSRVTIAGVEATKLSVSQGGDYAIRIRNINGCESQTYIAVPSQKVTLMGIDYCSLDTIGNVRLVTRPATSGKMQVDGTTLDTTEVKLPPGEYKIIAESALGCRIDTTVNIVNADVAY